MALTKQDKEWLELTIDKSVSKAVEPVVKQTTEHELTLYGKEGNNGIRSQVKGLIKFQYLVTGAIILGAALLGTVQLFAK